MRWRFLHSGVNPGDYNMRLDRSLADELHRGVDGSTIRVYGWHPPAISIGYHQSEGAIDREKAAAEGIDVVRRPTGGRAILHSDELTYCVVTVVDRDEVPVIYGRINAALLAGLRQLGVPASLSFVQPHFPSLYKNASSTVCFSNSARSEIQVEGKKLVGSAQRRSARNDGKVVILQHGSILIGPDHQRIVEFLRLTSEQKDALQSELKAKTIDLKSVLGEVSFDEVASAVRYGFETSWGIQFELAETEPITALT
ncbi:MAG TPA: lipoate--protein ligase family protein [Bacteroidota bacterium]|nr:lipoate--protein ligase family protein [Bacteroidota bacterium]